MQSWNRGVNFSLITLPLSRWLLARQSSTKLFVGGLSSDTNETVLKDAFGRHGEIIEVNVICYHVSGISKGYGFVRFASESAAATALKEMDGRLLDGRNIRVLFAHKNPRVDKKELNSVPLERNSEPNSSAS